MVSKIVSIVALIGGVNAAKGPAKPAPVVDLKAAAKKRKIEFDNWQIKKLANLKQRRMYFLQNAKNFYKKGDTYNEVVKVEADEKGGAARVDWCPLINNIRNSVIDSIKKTKSKNPKDLIVTHDKVINGFRKTVDDICKVYAKAGKGNCLVFDVSKSFRMCDYSLTNKYKKGEGLAFRTLEKQDSDKYEFLDWDSQPELNDQFNPDGTRKDPRWSVMSSAAIISARWPYVYAPNSAHYKYGLIFDNDPEDNKDQALVSGCNFDLYAPSRFKARADAHLTAPELQKLFKTAKTPEDARKEVAKRTARQFGNGFHHFKYSTELVRCHFERDYRVNLGFFKRDFEKSPKGCDLITAMKNYRISKGFPLYAPKISDSGNFIHSTLYGSMLLSPDISKADVSKHMDKFKKNNAGTDVITTTNDRVENEKALRQYVLNKSVDEEKATGGIFKKNDFKIIIDDARRKSEVLVHANHKRTSAILVLDSVNDVEDFEAAQRLQKQFYKLFDKVLPIVHWDRKAPGLVQEI